MTSPSGASVAVGGAVGGAVPAAGRAMGRARAAPPVLHSPAATTSAGAAVVAQPAHFLPPSQPSAQPAPPPVIAESLFGRPVLVAGCHGGAGTTTLARLVGAYDIGLWRPHPTPYPVILVARGTAQGATWASWSIHTALSWRVAPAALVIVGDGPWPEPRLARLRLRMLQAHAPVQIRLPYVSSWRYLDEPVRHPPKRVLHALEQLRRAINPDPPRR